MPKHLSKLSCWPEKESLKAARTYIEIVVHFGSNSSVVGKVVVPNSH